MIRRTSGNKGFTLIELLVATAIFGLVITGMYGVYSSTQKTTVNQGELVDVQQNLRVTGDFISQDIKMANALIPAGNTGIITGSNATTLNLSTASSFYAYAQVSSDLEIPAGTGASTTFSFNISVPTMVDYFEAGDTVRIIRPQNGKQPLDADLIVTGVNRAGPNITLNAFATTNAVQYKAGDIVARVSDSVTPPDPSTIVWDTNGTDLRRDRDGVGAEVMAENISNLTFNYLLKDGSEATIPLSTGDLDNIRAVRVTLTAETTRQLDGQTRRRSLSSITYLRNQ